MSPGRDQQQAYGGFAVAAGTARLLVVRFQRPGRARCATQRTSARSMPMPNALVATTTSSSPAMKARCTRSRCSPDMPAWYASTVQPCRASRCASSSEPRRVGAYTMAVPPPVPGPPRASISTPSRRRSRSRLASTSAARSARLGRAKPWIIWRRVGGQAETFQDLVAHHRGGGCRAGQHAGPRQKPQQLLELQVVGTEVVPPGADAVRLVDGHQRALDTLQGGPQPGVGQTLGGHVDQLEGAARERGDAPPHLVEGQGAGQVGGGDAALLQRRTWSCIRAISGETTTVVPGSSAAGAGRSGSCRRRSAPPAAAVAPPAGSRWPLAARRGSCRTQAAQSVIQVQPRAPWPLGAGVPGLAAVVRHGFGGTARGSGFGAGFLQVRCVCGGNPPAAGAGLGRPRCICSRIRCRVSRVGCEQLALHHRPRVERHYITSRAARRGVGYRERPCCLVRKCRRP